MADSSCFPRNHCWCPRSVHSKNSYSFVINFLFSILGFMGAMVRHLRSLRRMGRDYGWIHTLLEDAENERMHLLTAMYEQHQILFIDVAPPFRQLYEAGPVMRFMIVMAQGIFSNIFFIAYLISPRFCHRFVGYLEEEAVKTYTKLLKGSPSRPHSFL